MWIWINAIGFPEDGRAQAETCRELNYKQMESLIGFCRVQRWCVVNCYCTRVHGKCEILFYIIRTVLCVCMGDTVLCYKVANTLSRPVKNRVLKLDCGPSLNYIHETKTLHTFGWNYYTEYMWRTVIGFDFRLILASKFVWTYFLSLLMCIWHFPVQFQIITDITRDDLEFAASLFFWHH
jgi:hypothetical protein